MSTDGSSASGGGDAGQPKRSRKLSEEVCSRVKCQMQKKELKKNHLQQE